MARNLRKIIKGLDTSKTTGVADAMYHGPREVGSFYVDDNEEFIPDQSQLKYYVNPKPHLKLDLNEGIESFQRNKWQNNLENILHWIHLDPTRINEVDFVTELKTLVCLCETRYFNNEHGWNVRVQLYKGKYYMCPYNIDTKKDEELQALNYQRLKFKTISTTVEAGGAPDLSLKVDNITKYNRVMQASLSTGEETNCILFNARTDCCTQNNEPVNLKTYCLSKTERPNWFMHKRWWLQSYISGTPTVVCGFLSANGILEGVDEMNTKDIYTEWKSTMGKFPWHPVCFDFLANFLRAVKRVVTEEHPCAWFTFKAGGPVRYSWLEPDDNLLPDWYTSEMS